jgi:hypothetical protein
LGEFWIIENFAFLGQRVDIWKNNFLTNEIFKKIIFWKISKIFLIKFKLI